VAVTGPTPKPLDVGRIQDAPVVAAEAADSRTQSEENDWETQARAEVLRAQTQLTNQRKTFADRVFWLVVWWLSAIFGLLLLQGSLSPWGVFSIENSVLIALISGTTVNVIGVLFVVMRFLFPQRTSSSRRWRAKSESE